LDERFKNDQIGREFDLNRATICKCIKVGNSEPRGRSGDNITMDIEDKIYGDV
jgi:hypothetical protein